MVADSTSTIQYEPNSVANLNGISSAYRFPSVEPWNFGAGNTLGKEPGESNIGTRIGWPGSTGYTDN